jgi:hypothetical protein
MLQGVKMKRIERTRIEAFAAEFPFLGKILDMDQIEEANVSRIDEGLLHTRICAHEPKWIWQLGGGRRHAMFLLDRDGKILGRVAYRFHDQELVRFRGSETVQDCLADMSPQQRGKVFYALLHEIGNWERITLHKLPKAATDIDTWIESLVGAHRAVIKAACAKIDAEAESPAAK